MKVNESQTQAMPPCPCHPMSHFRIHLNSLSFSGSSVHWFLVIDHRPGGASWKTSGFNPNLFGSGPGGPGPGGPGGPGRPGPGSHWIPRRRCRRQRRLNGPPRPGPGPDAMRSIDDTGCFGAFWGVARCSWKGGEAEIGRKGANPGALTDFTGSEDSPSSQAAANLCPDSH